MISDENLDSRYLGWLEDQLGLPKTRNPRHTFSLLTEQLHQKEFYWSVPNDDNRIADGVDLRQEFVDVVGAERNYNFLAIDCSVLELLVALCRRLTFESDQNEYYWFRRILDNLGIGHYNDERYLDDINAEEIISDTFDVVIFRKYKSNGNGGLFPLRRPKQDQRKVEIWYQMSSYLLENNYE